MQPTKILAFAGSARAASFNKQLLRIAAEGARAAHASVTVLDLRDLPLPLFDQDLEADQGLPDNAKRFKALLVDHQGLLIASPEYNSSFSPLLKNAIDWATRAESEEEPPLLAFRGKVAAILSASPGALGGLRGLVQLRQLLGNIGVLVLPDQVTLPKAHEAFDSNGQLTAPRKLAQTTALGRSLADLLVKIAA